MDHGDSLTEVRVWLRNLMIQFPAYDRYLVPVISALALIYIFRAP